MLRAALTVASIAVLSACANHTPTKQALMNIPGFMNASETTEIQRPRLPVSHYVRWSPADRFQYSVELDYITGMSQRDYLFEEPNQQLFRPMVNGLLSQSGLKAKSAAGARYALQIEFKNLDTDAFGRHFAGKTDAVYRLVDRYTGEVAYERTIGSRFIALYPGLNERDASFAYDVSSQGVIGATKAFGEFTLYEGGAVELWNNNGKLRDFFGGDAVNEVSQGGWNDAYQSYAWVTGVSALTGPALVLLGQLNPLNYVSLQLEPRGELERSAIAQNGNLAESGFGSRSARKRAQQLNTHLLAQSLTLFLLDLAQQEDIRFTKLIACNSTPSDTSEIIDQVRLGMQVVTDDCRRYQETPGIRGVPVSTYE